jgi:hypothetical protein
MTASRRVVTALERLKDVYSETPDVRLSLDEASSISGLDRHSCGHILAALVDVRFLTRDATGTYRRRVPVEADHV